MRVFIVLVVWCIACVDEVIAQPATKNSKDVYVDDLGVLRWGDSKKEVHAFGVNYTVPFAYAFRAAKQLNVPLEKAIDNDIYHFARLGFDAYRVHVWDCEISDTAGNLLTNEHLKLFDYTIMKMKARGMKFIITPIAYWNNGYPEPDENTPGFSAKYGKPACLTNPDAIKAQERYLHQFLNHVNAYTGVAYKDEPSLIAFEICNEPHHGEAPPAVTSFIKRMVKSMRTTGCKKPILYNISHSIHLVDAYFNAGIQGGTFQWYPTGLGSRHELKGNLLPNVDHYQIPFADNKQFKKGAKIVYEFDAADVGRSYIYPAMARSFRTAGMQVATHFAYDPTYLAYANTEYGTHYMNLAYAPQKALSLKIAAEVFHTVPLYKDFGSYPANASFDNFHVSYEHDLAELVTEKKFIYTNTTTAAPATLNNLEQVAGFGNSPVVRYEGQGAYFLDKIKNGLWRLEVMPDAIWVNDPFGRTSLKKEISVINWRTWPMLINLPDLGEGFTIKGINEGNDANSKANGKSFSIAPGTYMLTHSGSSMTFKNDTAVGNISMNEFVAPATTLTSTYVLHKPVQELTVGEGYTMEAKIVSVDEPQVVEVSIFNSWKPEIITLQKVSGYDYKAVVPSALIKEGFLTYYISIKDKNGYHTYPSGTPNRPVDWDFFSDKAYQIPVVLKTTPVYLFDALHDTEELSRQWLRTSTLIPLAEPGKAELQVNVDKLFEADPENKTGPIIHDYSFRYSFGQKITGRERDISSMKKLVFKGRSLNDKPCKLQLALVMKDGTVYGDVLLIETNNKDYSLLLTDLKKVKLVTLPRPYPSFLPYYFSGSSTQAFDMNAVESIQFSIGPGIAADDLKNKHGVAVESVRLE